MTEVRNIYLSPHFDDIAFSLGSLISAEDGGTLVNVFTRSPYIAGRELGRTPDAAEVDRVSAVRSDEDRAFAERYRLRVVDLGRQEAILRGLHPFAGEDVSEGAAQIRPALKETLDILVSDAAARIFCPAGIGRHVDHLAVRAVAIEWYRAKKRSGQLWFYEDLPYASRLRARYRGLFDLRRVTAPLRLRRRTWPANTTKLAQINDYASQHLAPVKDLRSFSPAAVWPLGSHEAAWQIVGQTGRDEHPFVATLAENSSILPQV
jgi:LmbE family N-acetylglucosaminyl deacetylase